jgi:hypothetical protein
MIPCENYSSYVGPDLVKTMLGSEDVTDDIRVVYGQHNNWQGNLWTFKEVFGEKSLNKNYRFDFTDKEGRTYWFNGFITDLNQYFNPPLIGK